MGIPAIFARLRSRAEWFGVRRSAWLEMAVFFLVALGWDHFLGEGTRFTHLSPHPFWAIVLLMSGFYGLREGLVAAVAAALLYRAGYLPEQRIDQQVYDYAWLVMREPLLWLLVASVLGEIRRQHGRHERELKEEVAASRDRLDALGEAYKRLDAVKDRLETRVVGQATTAVQLYRAVQGADRLDVEGVEETIAEVVRATLAPEAFSLYLLRGDTLELVLNEGWPAEVDWPRRYAPNAPLFDAVVAGRRSLCAAQPVDEVALGGQGLLAGPLVDPWSGQIVGMLKVERMRFLDFNFSNLHAFRALCQWIASTYQNARRFEETKADRAADQSTQLYSMTYLERQRAYLTAMAQRFQFDLSMLVLRIEDLDDLTREERVAVASAISRSVRTALRRTDLAFEYRREAGEVAVLMPGTSIANGHFVARKLEEAIRVQLARPLRMSMRTRAVYLATGEAPREPGEAQGGRVSEAADGASEQVA
jgi:polysaccharide biosynthesis protein PelD